MGGDQGGGAVGEAQAPALVALSGVVASREHPGVLYAHGSGIAPGRRVESVRAIDLHPTVTSLLGIQPGQPQDGVAQADLLH